MDKDLEGLLDQALIERGNIPARNLRETPAQLNKRLTKLLDERFDALFKAPENWTLRRTIALIHRETDTFLGVFNELVHNTVANCRRLVRTEGTPEGIEREIVEGPQWLTRETEQLHAATWQETHDVCADLHIPSLGMSALGALVQVHVNTEAHGITKVCLSAPTKFAAAGRHDFLYLPQGTNVLPELSTLTKLAIKAEIDL